MKNIIVKVGHVASDSGLLMVADPANINEHWKKIHVLDLDKDKSYFHIPTAKTLEYGKDFIGESQPIDAINGLSIMEAKENGEIIEHTAKKDNTFNLRGAISTAESSKDFKDTNWMLAYPENGLPGIGLVFEPGGNEGVYPVYALIETDDAGVSKVES